MAQRRIDTISDDALFADWKDWIGVVREDLHTLAWHRRVFADVSQVFEHNQHLQEVGGFLHDWMALSHAACAAMFIRRDLDRANHRGLVHLLGEIAKRPRVLSRRRYYTEWGACRDKFEQHRRRHAFEAVALVSPTGDELDDHICPKSVEADVKRLRQDTQLVHDFIEQRVAHRSTGTVAAITWSQFHGAIDAVTPTFKKYYARITLQALVDMEPAAQFNKHEPFTFPWDVTCDQIWQELRGNQRLPWERIAAVYRPAEGAAEPN